MSAVLVAFDAGLRIELGVTVTTDVRTFIDEEDFFTEDVRNTLGHSEAKETSTDNEDIRSMRTERIGTCFLHFLIIHK